MSFILDWLAEPKSDRVRHGTMFGCLAAALLGIPLLFLVLAFAAVPHCKTCASQAGSHLIAGVALATLFGLAAGVVAAAARTFLQRVLGKVGAAILLMLCIAAAAYFSLSPALTLIIG